jgi:hypothetical protein
MTNHVIYLILLIIPLNLHAAMIGYADVVLDYHDSGAGPVSGPYGGTHPGSFPVPVSTDVVLEDDPGASVDFLSLPTGSYVTVGFTDETVIDGICPSTFRAPAYDSWLSRNWLCQKEASLKSQMTDKNSPASCGVV